MASYRGWDNNYQMSQDPRQQMSRTRPRPSQWRGSYGNPQAPSAQRSGSWGGSYNRDPYQQTASTYQPFRQSSPYAGQKGGGGWGGGWGSPQAGGGNPWGGGGFGGWGGYYDRGWSGQGGGWGPSYQSPYAKSDGSPETTGGPGSTSTGGGSTSGGYGGGGQGSGGTGSGGGTTVGSGGDPEGGGPDNTGGGGTDPVGGTQTGPGNTGGGNVDTTGGTGYGGYGGGASVVVEAPEDTTPWDQLIGPGSHEGGWLGWQAGLDRDQDRWMQTNRQDWTSGENTLDRDWTANQVALDRDWRTNERLGTQDWTSGENVLDRNFAWNLDHARNMFDWNTRVDQNNFNWNTRVDTQNYDWADRVDTQNFDWNTMQDMQDHDWNTRVDSQNFDWASDVRDNNFDWASRIDTQNYNWELDHARRMFARDAFLEKSNAMMPFMPGAHLHRAGGGTPGAKMQGGPAASGKPAQGGPGGGPPPDGMNTPGEWAPGVTDDPRNTAGLGFRPHLNKPSEADDRAAEQAAFGREAERVSDLTQGALRGLTDSLAQRGFTDAGAGGAEAALSNEIMGEGRGMLADTIREQTLQKLGRQRQVADRNLAADLSQRGQDVQQQGNLWGARTGMLQALFNSGSGLY